MINSAMDGAIFEDKAMNIRQLNTGNNKNLIIEHDKGNATFLMLEGETQLSTIIRQLDELAKKSKRIRARHKMLMAAANLIVKINQGAKQ